WSSIFSQVPVGAHVPVTPQPLDSYDAAGLLGKFHDIYDPDVRQRQPPRDKAARAMARLRPSGARLTREQRVFAAFLNFHRPPYVTPALRLEDDPPTNADALDFHATVSALGRYPAAMHALGLVFDLPDLPTPSFLPSARGGNVRVRPVSELFPPEWQIVYP